MKPTIVEDLPKTVFECLIVMRMLALMFFTLRFEIFLSQFFHYREIDSINIKIIKSSGLRQNLGIYEVIL